jgi:AcrR family transcriptional regulator
MRVFWENGYEATSTQDLCAATGLGRSSIYNTFTSKHELFVRALGHYLDTMSAAQAAVLEDAARPAVERVRALFASVIDGEYARPGRGRSIGCLSVNTTVELAGRDARVAEVLDRDLDRRLDGLREVLRAGQRAGEVTTERDADGLARFLNAVIGGMRVSAQGGAGRDVLEAIAATAVDALLPPTGARRREA